MYWYFSFFDDTGLATLFDNPGITLNNQLSWTVWNDIQKTQTKQEKENKTFTLH